MDCGLDRAIERLNELKLHAPTPNGSANAPPPSEGNQREDVASLQDQYARMAQQMQDQFARQLKEQERALAQRMQHEMQQMQRRVDALEHQNQLLRSAVGTVEHYKAQVADQQVQIETLTEQVRQLRQTNYRLQYMVQQNDRSSLGGSNHFLPPPPPDIF